MKKFISLAALAAYLALSSGCSTFIFKHRDSESCGGDGKWLSYSQNTTVKCLVRAGFDVMQDRCSPEDVLYIRPKNNPECKPERINCSYDGTMVKFENTNRSKPMVNHFLNNSLDNEFQATNYEGIRNYYLSLNPCKK